MKQKSVGGFIELLVLAVVLGFGCAPRNEENGVEVAQAVSEPSSPPATAADAADELEAAALQAGEKAAEQASEQRAEQEARELAQREELVRAREAELARQELAERERRVREREREVAEREANLREEQERAQAAAEAEQQAAREAEEAAEAARAREAAEIAAKESGEESAVEPTTAADAAVDREDESWTGDEAWRRGSRGDDSRDGAVSADEDTSAGDRAATAAPSASPELLRAGMRLDVEIDSTLSSGTSQVGDEFKTVLVDDVRTEDGTLVAPAGSEVWGKVVEARPLRKVGGQAALGVSLDRLVLPSGETVEIQASLLQVGKNKKGDKAKIAGAVIAGAILGSILGDSDGALVGAAAGAAASTAYVIKAQGREVEIPAGTVVTLEIDEVVTVRTEYRTPR